MIETLFITLVITVLALGVTEQVVIPVAKEVIEVTAEGVDKAIDYVMPSTPEE